MIQLVYRLRGMDALRARFRNMADPGNKRRALLAISFFLEEQTLRRFETETDPWGRPWRPLAPATLARRRHGGSRILQDTGRLKGSWRRGVTGDAAFLRAGVYYAAFHQYGTRTRSGREHVPPRKMLPEKPWPEVYLRGIRAIVRRHYGVHRAG